MTLDKQKTGRRESYFKLKEKNEGWKILKSNINIKKIVTIANKNEIKRRKIEIYEERL